MTCFFFLYHTTNILNGCQCTSSINLIDIHMISVKKLTISLVLQNGELGLGLGLGRTNHTLVPWKQGYRGWDETTDTLVPWIDACKGLGIQQGMSVWVGAPKSVRWWVHVDISTSTVKLETAYFQLSLIFCTSIRSIFTFSKREKQEFQRFHVERCWPRERCVSLLLSEENQLGKAASLFDLLNCH